MKPATPSRGSSQSGIGAHLTTRQPTRVLDKWPKWAMEQMRHLAHRSHAVVIGSRAGFYLAYSQLGRLGGKSPTCPPTAPAAQSDKA